MIKEILSSNQSKLELKKKLKSFVDDIFKNPSQLEKELTADQLPVISHKLASISFGLTLDLIFNGLSIEECLCYAGYEQFSRSILLDLLDLVLQEKTPEKYLKVAAAFDRHSGLEKGLAILTGYSKYCLNEITEQCLPKLVPRFIRICAFTIQKYLTLKNEPANGADDRHDNDQIILSHCERWVSTGIKQFFKGLIIPQQQSIKECTLYGVGDLIGALLQLLREKTLNSEVLEELLEQCLIPYAIKVFSYQFIYEFFLKNLKHNNFANPEEKVLIPEKYETNTFRNLNTAAFAYLTYLYINSCQAIFTPSETLKYLALAASQIVSRHYQIKTKIVERILIILNRFSIKICDGKQLNYPIGLFLFYFWNFQRQQYSKVRNGLIFSDEALLVNILVELKQIRLEGLGGQQNEFLLTLLKSEHPISPRSIIILREIALEGILNAHSSELFTEICQKMLDSTIKQQTKSFLYTLLKNKTINQKLFQAILANHQ